MPHKKTKKPQSQRAVRIERELRIETERSQPYVMTPKRARATVSMQQRLRDQANRIVELEEKIAALSRGEPLVSVSAQCIAVIDRLTATGLYGDTSTETAAQLLTAKVRSEMQWLATGNAS